MDSENRVNLLIVEDDVGLARLQQKRLERAGYVVCLAASAEEATRRLKDGAIDLLVLDQMLPGGVSGLELYRRLKADGVDVPAILVTGHSAEAMLLEALRAGVRDFVAKTTDYLDYLLPAVERVLRQVRIERQLAESNARAREALRRQHELEAEVAERLRKEQALRQAEEALRETDRRKDEFLAMLAHELRNPLAPIRNAVHILRLLAPAEENLRSPLDVIDRQLRQLTDLVDDLLDVSRITRGKVQLRKQVVTLASVVAQAVETSRPILEARRHHFEVSLPSETIHVEADPTRLAQVLLNLLNNAAKYTPEGGRVSLIVETTDAADSGGEVVVRVRDSGVGIPIDMLPKVFDLFAQVEYTLDQAQGGLGIGLTLVRRLVEMHGGSVRAVSEGRGHGSEFVVQLPIAAKVVKTVAVDDDKEDQKSDTSRRRILVVDDNTDNAESLAMLLRFLGHDVRTAHDGEAGLEAARHFQPHVALLDIGLPRLDGLEMARRLRGDAVLKDVSLIAMTGYGQEEDRRRSLSAGFDAHLVKPVDLGSLQTLLESLTRRTTGMAV